MSPGGASLWGAPTWCLISPGPHSSAFFDSTAFYLTLPLALNCPGRRDWAEVSNSFPELRAQGAPQRQQGWSAWSQMKAGGGSCPKSHLLHPLPLGGSLLPHPNLMAFSYLPSSTSSIPPSLHLVSSSNWSGRTGVLVAWEGSAFGLCSGPHPATSSSCV